MPPTVPAGRGVFLGPQGTKWGSRLCLVVAATLIAVGLSTVAVLTPAPASGATLHGTGSGYCSQAETGGYSLGPSMPTPSGPAYACGPLPLDNLLDKDSGPAIPTFWPITDNGGFQCTELAVRYLYLMTSGRILLSSASNWDGTGWDGEGRDFAGAVGPHFEFGGEGQHIDGRASTGVPPQRGDILSEWGAGGGVGDVGIVKSVSPTEIVLMAQNNTSSGLNPITLHSSTSWSINSPGSGFYYTSFRWFSPGAALPTVSMPESQYRYDVHGTRTGSLDERAAPSSTSAVQHVLPEGNTLYLTCQATGSDVNGSEVWDKLTNGGWVPDYYVDTPDVGTFSYPVPPCGSPGWWVYKATAASAERAGPSPDDPAVGQVAAGADVSVVCFTTGPSATALSVGGSATWDYVLGKGYLPNADVHAPATVGVPTCPSVNTSGKRQNNAVPPRPQPEPQSQKSSCSGPYGPLYDDGTDMWVTVERLCLTTVRKTATNMETMEEVGDPSGGIISLTLKVDAKDAPQPQVFGDGINVAVSLVDSAHHNFSWTAFTDDYGGGPYLADGLAEADGRSCFDTNGQGYTVEPGQVVVLPDDFCWATETTGTSGKTSVELPVLSVQVDDAYFAVKQS